MKKIKIGILGYGNLARGVECAAKQNQDMEVRAVFTRRNPQTVEILSPDAKVFPVEELAKPQNIDVLILCGGSAEDLPVQTPYYAERYNVIDSFDNHTQIPEHFEAVDSAAKKGSKTALISVGWDPGLFSLNRALMSLILPKGQTHTFWGRGISQGHSDAVRRIKGVKDARQYTIPASEAIDAARKGEQLNLTAQQKHRRECFVVVEEGADLNRIREEIVTMPSYFEGYNTKVHFITEEELKREHAGFSHGGLVIRTGSTGWEGENKASCELSIEMDSNPEFTGSVLAAYARAVCKLSEEGNFGCKTIFDIPLSYTFSKPKSEMIAQFL